MVALLGQAGVIDDPGTDRAMTFDRRQDLLAHFGQNGLIRPRRIADKMQQRLVFGRTLCRRRHGSDRLHRLAFQGHQQARTILVELCGTARPPDNLAEPRHVRCKSGSARPRSQCHPTPPRYQMPNLKDNAWLMEDGLR